MVQLQRETQASMRNTPPFQMGHREIILCEAILQSHREQRWIKVKE